MAFLIGCGAVHSVAAGPDTRGTGVETHRTDVRPGLDDTPPDAGAPPPRPRTEIVPFRDGVCARLDGGWSCCGVEPPAPDDRIPHVSYGHCVLHSDESATCGDLALPPAPGRVDIMGGCWLHADGTLWCLPRERAWTETGWLEELDQVEAFTYSSSSALAGHEFCALRDGHVLCVAAPVAGAWSDPFDLFPRAGVVSVVAGLWGQVCALHADGGVECVGGVSPSGYGSVADRCTPFHPREVALGERLTTITAVAMDAFCGTGESGRVWCWGLGPAPVLGVAGESPISAPLSDPEMGACFEAVVVNVPSSDFGSSVIRRFGCGVVDGAFRCTEDAPPECPRGWAVP